MANWEVPLGAALLDNPVTWVQQVQDSREIVFPLMAVRGASREAGIVRTDNITRERENIFQSN